MALLGVRRVAALGAAQVSRLAARLGRAGATWRLLRDDPALILLLIFWRIVYPVLRRVYGRV
jgi:hypothetical protein